MSVHTANLKGRIGTDGSGFGAKGVLPLRASSNFENEIDDTDALETLKVYLTLVKV
jgi:hypothetical protein